MSTDLRVRAAREYLAAIRKHKVNEQPLTVLVRECAELRRLLGQVLDYVAQAEPERDRDLERWLTNQMARARPQAPDESDLDAIRQLAAMRDPTLAETVARWLREVREAPGD